MNVLIAGACRSGSTALYNMARLLMERTYGVDNVYAGRNDVQWPGKPHAVLHHHQPSEAHRCWADVILTSHRDLLDVVASDKRCNEIIHGKPYENTPESLLDVLATVVGCHMWWKPFTDFEMRYCTFVDRPRGVLRRVVAALADEDTAFDGADSTGIVEEIQGYKSGDYTADNRNLICEIARTDGRAGAYGEFLEQWEIDTVLKYYSWWQRDNGYRTE
jgi:hypothetical protein